MALNLFPVRASIGRATLPDNTVIEVLMTTEFARALSDLSERVGGVNGIGNTDLETLLSVTMGGDVQTAPPYQPAEPVPEIAILTAQVADLQQQVQQMMQLVQVVASGGLSVGDMEQMLANPDTPTPVDWTRPGKIGLVIPRSGAFTTLSSTLATAVGTNLTVGGNATVGTGVAVTTAAVNGTSSGAGGGAFGVIQNGGTTVAALGNVSAVLGGAYDATPVFYYNGSLLFSRAGVSHAQAFAGGRWYFGATPADDGVTTVYANGSIKAATSVQAVTSFGCNGKTPQNSVASGGAVAGTASTNVTPFGYTTAAQADAVVARLNTIQSALIANGILS